MKSIFQIKITLNDTNPPVWRQLLVEPNTVLEDLHKIIQTSMGWTNSHLHQFVYDGKSYSNPDYNDELDDELQIDYRNISIGELTKKKGQIIVYEYDFGDGWEHTIMLETIMTEEKDKEYPICIAGQRNCPPEDCGGTPGYESLLETIADPHHSEYESMMEWLGGDFNPDEFNINEVNDMLREDDYGCAMVED